MIRRSLRLAAAIACAAMLSYQPAVALHAQDCAWKVVSAGTLPVNNVRLVSADADSPTDVWAAGLYETPSGLAAGTAVEHFNGSTWSLAAAADEPNAANALSAVSAASPSDVWAVGSFTPNGGSSRPLAERWNGSTWTITPFPAASGRNFLTAVKAFAPDDAWAIGYAVNNSAVTSYAARWDGSKWNSVALAPVGENAQLFGMTGMGDNDLWVVGTARGRNGEAKSVAEHLDGNSWAVVPMKSPGRAVLLSVTEIAPNDVWAVGTSSPDHVIQFLNLSEHWDGTSWRVVPIPSIKGRFNYLYTVAHASRNDVWAVGSSAVSSGSVPMALRWNGHRWILQDTVARFPGYNSEFFGAAVVGPDDVLSFGSVEFKSTLVEGSDCGTKAR
jgi:hypothetical protein